MLCVTVIEKGLKMEWSIKVPFKLLLHKLTCATDYEKMKYSMEVFCSLQAKSFLHKIMDCFSIYYLVKHCLNVLVATGHSLHFVSFR